MLTRRDFLGRSLRATGALALGSCPALSAPVSEVSARRLERLTTGANVCRWFRFPRRDSTEHFENYLADSEAALMAELGLKHVRLCIHPRVIMEESTGTIREERAAQLEAALRRFHKSGLLVVVDIHNEDREAELNPAWQDAFAKFWSALAARLSKLDPDLTVLEIINEPVFRGRESEWDALNARLAAAIRNSAPQTPS